MKVKYVTGDVGAVQQVFQAHVRGLVLTGVFDNGASAGRMLLLELRIATTPPSEINSMVLRRPELAAFRDECLALYGRIARDIREKSTLSPDLDPEVKATIERRMRARIKAASRKAIRGQSQTRGDAFYRRIALDFIELVESGKPTPGGVLETLADLEAERLGMQVPVQTLRTWLSVARTRGFLAPATPGRLSAAPGPKLYDLEGS